MPPPLCVGHTEGGAAQAGGAEPYERPVSTFSPRQRRAPLAVGVHGGDKLQVASRLGVGLARIGSRLQDGSRLQQRRALGLVALPRIVQGGLAELILQAGVRPQRQQHRADLRVAAVGGEHQRGALEITPRIELRSVRAQRLRRLIAPRDTCNSQRRLTRRIPPLQLRPLPEKFKDEGQIVRLRGVVQFSSVRLPQKKAIKTSHHHRSRI